MSFIVSARKYRPQQFEEVIGQEHITDTLKMALMQDKLAHAFLFTGPRGVGKTSCARILAKIINCEQGENGQSCNSCSSCLAFQEHASFNIIELDAASNNSVEHMRTLIEQVRFQPQHGKFKVFIIDEVHMLSSAAFNAFLKTLEEPPSYAIFILATTEKHKIIPTILSRCQIFDFKRIMIADIIRQLEEIAKLEKINIDQDAFFFIAEKADGALRDALSIFDRIVSSSHGDVSYQDVIEKLNILDHNYYFKIADAVIRADSVSCLTLFNEIFQNGFEGDHFMNGLAEHFRKLLLSKDIEAAKLLEISDTLKKRYYNQAQIYTASDLMSCLDLANQCDLNYPKAKNKRLHVEINLLKMAYLGQLRKNPSSTAPVMEKKTAIPKIQPQSNEPIEKKATEMIKEAPASIISAPTKDALIKDTPSLNSIDQLIQEVKVSTQKEQALEENLDLEKIKQIWKKHIDEHQSPSIKNALVKAIHRLEGKELVIDVPSSVCKEIILQESSLIEKIRKELNAPLLILKVLIDRSKFPESQLNKPKKFFTAKEKYDLLKEKNPHLKVLIKELELKLDQDYG